MKKELDFRELKSKALSNKENEILKLDEMPMQNEYDEFVFKTKRNIIIYNEVLNILEQMKSKEK
jgi:hypothetical protein